MTPGRAMQAEPSTPSPAPTSAVPSEASPASPQGLPTMDGDPGTKEQTTTSQMKENGLFPSFFESPALLFILFNSVCFF
jgi:hypothetical protein